MPLGIDVSQWRVLVRLSLLLDLRRTRGYSFGVHERRGALGTIIGLLLFQAATGGLLAYSIVVLPDRFASATLYFLLLMASLAGLLLIDFHAIVLAPDDFGILAYRPITSRTFFVSRLTSLLLFVSVLALATSLAPVFVWTWMVDGPLVGLAALVATLLASALTALAVATVYGTLLRMLPANRLQRWLGYAQLALTFAVYGSILLLSRFHATVLEIRVEKSWPQYLNPAAWFAAWVEIAAGRAGSMDWVAATAPVGLLVILVRVAAGRLSLEYADRLSSLSGGVAAATRVSGTRIASIGARMFRPEHRAIDLLVRAQFRVDQRFRLGVVSILPLTLLYLVIGLDGASRSTGAGTTWLDVAVVVFPSVLRQALTRSDAFRAAWVYFAMPADLTSIVLATKNVVLVRFLVPYLLFVTALLAASSLSDGTLTPGVAMFHLAHAVWLGFLSHAILMIELTANPALPFSIPPSRGERTWHIALITVAAIALAEAMPFAYGALFGSVAHIAAALAALLVVNALLHRLLLWRTARIVERLAYAG
ncbi:MAG: hypothetical protein GEU99_15945 [Luteitalea sp.]|nr:hypothetical protein [Luteitalea sp.]